MNLRIESESEATKELYKMAILSRQNSYSPYSHCQVGAAVRLANGKLYAGCNVENSSYGASVCAERVAIQKAVSEQGRLEVTSLMVVTDATPPWPPCGMCRQVIAEFGRKIEIYLANLTGDLIRTSLGELFPSAFTSEHLPIEII